MIKDFNWMLTVIPQSRSISLIHPFSQCEIWHLNVFLTSNVQYFLPIFTLNYCPWLYILLTRTRRIEKRISANSHNCTYPQTCPCTIPYVLSYHHRWIARRLSRFTVFTYAFNCTSSVLPQVIAPACLPLFPVSFLFFLAIRSILTI